jgi:tetratricopeptide (TPR) repeat protein
MAAALTMAVVVVSSGAGWVASEQATRRQVTERGVAAAREESLSWQREGRLPEALSAARRAAGLAAGGEAVGAVRRQADARVADLELLERLDTLRLEYASGVKDAHFDAKLADDLYRDAFEKAGLDVEALSAPEAVGRLRGTSVPIELAAALDHWALVRQTERGPADPSWKHLLQVARAADPDPLRTQLREALERRDGPALEKLARSDEVFGLLPATLGFLALNRAPPIRIAPERALALLRESQRRHPNDFWANEALGLLLELSQPPQMEEAIRFYTAALAVRPQASGAHVNLGNALFGKGRLDEAVAEFREAIRLKNRYAGAHCSLGYALYEKHDLDGAMTEFRQAIDLDPNCALAYVWLGNVLFDRGNLAEAEAAQRKAVEIGPDLAEAHAGLGEVLHEQGKLAEAEAADRKAIALNPDLAEAHCNLGYALYRQGRLEEAEAALRKAIALKPGLAVAHLRIGVVLKHQGKLAEAEAADRKAIALQPDLAQAHNNLGAILLDKGQLDEAIAEFREAIRLKRDYFGARYNLGNALRQKGDLEGAIAEYREAIRINKDFPGAHCNLGLVLRDKGQFAEALTHLRASHELGSKDPRWPHPSAQWVKQCQRLIELDGKLPSVLSGKEQPASPAERAEYAEVCCKKRLYAAAARLSREAIAAQPALVASPVNGLRYNAACAAALAGSGAGEDAAKLTDAERVALRKQALEWLRADLAAWRGLLEKQPDRARLVVAEQMQHWLGDTDFAGVRGPDALAKLPEAERKDWEKLWADVADLLRRAADKPPQPRDGDKKP